MEFTTIANHSDLPDLLLDTHPQYFADTTIGTRAKNYTTSGTVQATTLSDGTTSIASGTITLAAAGNTIADGQFTGDWDFNGDDLTDIGTINNAVIQCIDTGNYGFGNSSTLNPLVTGSHNVAIGDSAGAAITSGSFNFCIGTSAGAALTTQDSNLLIGSEAGFAVTSISNVAIGTNALRNTGVGGSGANVAIGADALRGATGSGSFNVAIGNSAGKDVSTSSRNVFIGSFAGENVVNATGWNTIVGHSAGTNLTTGSFNTLIGGDAGDSLAAGDSSNICIGYQAGKTNATGSNELWIHNVDAANTASLIYGVFSTTVADQRLRINADFTTTAGRKHKTLRITGNTTLSEIHHEVFCDTDGGSFTVTLPVGVDGRNYLISNVGSSGNAVTVTPDGSEKFLGENSSYDILDGDDEQITFEPTEGWR